MLVVTTWMITAGRWNLLQTTDNADLFFDGVFDAQARAMLNGHVDVPADVARFEGLLRGGKTYVYFGVFPSLLRMPVLLVTGRFDRQLATVSMLLATTVLTISSLRLNSILRLAIRGLAPVSRREMLATAGLAASVLAGPPLLLASGHYIYHESILWGLAWSVAGFDAVARWQRNPTATRLAVAGSVITLAMLSRQSVAIGPLVALSLVGVTRIWQAWRDEPRISSEVIRAVAKLSLAGLIPVALSTGFHYARTGAVLGLDVSRLEAWHDLAGLSHEDDAFFAMGARNLDETIEFYLRPIGVEFREDFPWVDFPIGARQSANQDIPFPTFEWTPGLHWVSPALFALSLVGMAWGLRTVRQRTMESWLWPLAIGSLASGAGAFLFWGASARYLGDIFPVLIVGGFVGFHALGASNARLPRWVRNSALTTMAILVVAGAAVTAALSLELQRERWYNVPDPWRREMIRWRLQLPGAPEPSFIASDETVPTPHDGELLVIGDCGHRYASVEGRWIALGPTGSITATNPRAPELSPDDARECFF